MTCVRFLNPSWVRQSLKMGGSDAVGDWRPHGTPVSATEERPVDMA